MTIFKNILFLQDYPGGARTGDERGRSYAQGYGNHVASAQAFAPLGHAHATDPQGSVPARRHASPAGRCPAAACA